jgi:hypothetical protein
MLSKKLCVVVVTITRCWIECGMASQVWLADFISIVISWILLGCSSPSTRILASCLMNFGETLDAI